MRENHRVRKTHVMVMEGTYLSIGWHLVRAKLGRGQLGEFELVTAVSLESADVQIREYIRGIRDDVCTKLGFAGISLKPKIVKNQSEVKYNGSPAYLLATFSPL